MAATAATVIAPEVMIPLMAKSVADDYATRAAAGQTITQSLGGAAADASGINGMYIGMNNRDIATGNFMDYSPQRQADSFTTGAFQFGFSAILASSSSARQGAGEMSTAARQSLGNVLGLPSGLPTLPPVTPGQTDITVPPEAAPNVAGTAPREVTTDTIQAALQGSTMQTAQGSVSIPVVERYVRLLEAGSSAPPITTAGETIIDGHHTYIAGRVFGVEPPQIPGTLSPSQAPRVRSILEINLDPTDWGVK
jgi:hypothetical protein